MLCQSRLQTDSETFVRHKKIVISVNFLRFHIHSMHLIEKDEEYEKKMTSSHTDFVSLVEGGQKEWRRDSKGLEGREADNTGGGWGGGGGGGLWREGGAMKETGGAMADQLEGRARDRREQEEPGRTQTPALMAAHGGADRGRSHGRERADKSRGPTDASEAGGGGARGRDGETMSQGGGEYPEGQGGADGLGNRGAGGDPEGRSGAERNRGPRCSQREGGTWHRRRDEV